MINILLKSSDKLRSLLPGFEGLLAKYNLPVIKRSQKDGIIELAINTLTMDEIKQAHKIALGFFFKDELVSLRIAIPTNKQLQLQTTLPPEELIEYAALG